MFALEQESQNTARLYPGLPPGEALRVRVPEVWVRAEPRRGAAVWSQYTYGEALRLLERRGPWSHCQSQRDGYCGWVPTSALGLAGAAASHETLVPTLVLSRPDLKSTPLATLPPDATVALETKRFGYGRVAGLGWVDERNLVALDARQDIVATATAQLGRPYVWGGRGLAGLDCSALAQYCYRRAGRLLPRDSDLQRLYLAKFHGPVALDELAAGDLVFLPGHVMVAINNEEVIHASARPLRVVREALRVVLARQPDAVPVAYRWLNPGEKDAS